MNTETTAGAGPVDQPVRPRRDALKQAAEKERVGGVEAKSGAINPACSSFCAVGEPCAITADGRCDAELTHNAGIER